MLMLTRSVSDAFVVGQQRVSLLSIKDNFAEIEVSRDGENSTSERYQLALQQSVSIADGVQIVFVECRTDGNRKRARLGIEAPGDIPVLRGELIERLRRTLPRAGNSNLT